MELTLVGGADGRLVVPHAPKTGDAAAKSSPFHRAVSHHEGVSAIDASARHA